MKNLQKFETFFYQLWKTIQLNIHGILLTFKNYFICLKYPFLKIESDVYPWVISYGTIWLDDLPIGWQKAFVWDLCKEIKEYNKKHNIKDYHISQVKEKYGGLRWYDNGDSKFYNTVLEKYEELSYRTCCQCGKEATNYSTGWILPYCNDCKNEILKREPNRIFNQMKKNS